MAMSPGNQAITGGTVLRTPAIQSPNYSPGVSGWIIRADGSAEFNAGTFRGSIEVGSLSGQHFWVNNPNTGDVIDVYNSSNQLVFSIDATGRLVSYSRIDTRTVVLTGGSIFLEDTTQTPQINPEISGLLTADETDLLLSAGLPQNAAGGNQGAIIQLSAGNALTAPFIETTQRNVTGMMLQTDSLNQNQLVHVAHYSLTTDAGGSATFNHGCPFTPLFGFLSCVFTAAANGFYEYAWFNAPFTATTAHAHFNSNTGASVANTAIEFYGWFVG